MGEPPSSCLVHRRKREVQLALALARRASRLVGRRGPPDRPSVWAGPRAALLLAALAVAGCSNVDRTVATSAVPVDYHQRHPVALVDAPQTLDIFLIGAGQTLDYRQKHDVEAFAADFQAHGESRIRILVPNGTVAAASATATLEAVKRGLAASGVKGDVEVGYYRAAGSRIASTVRLSFVKLQAKATTRCGEWPENLGPDAGLEDWENKSYYNFGCASQQTLAAQADDPRALIRPRAEDPSDVQMRTRPIQLLRGSPDAPVSQDPTTPWGFHFVTLGTSSTTTSN